MSDTDSLTETELNRLKAQAQILVNTVGIMDRCLECRRPILITPDGPRRCVHCYAGQLMLEPGGRIDPYPE
ncbi:MAG TPA: hypothetical protein VMZ92_20990 [Planctomycetota bacterium]|nr:hypothetical protein [Planctomycetota bacterium]HUX16953.1 hypothetical protein [Phycisphaerae bacterium]